MVPCLLDKRITTSLRLIWTIGTVVLPYSYIIGRAGLWRAGIIRWGHSDGILV